jgi:trehalose utilization protein
MSLSIHATVWNEFIHERQPGKPQEIYPQGIHAAIAGYLNTQAGIRARTSTLEEPEHGLTAEVLAGTDVLFWWGHRAHDQVDDAIVKRVQDHMLAGMGLVVLHSGHASKILKLMLGTHCSLRWREADEREILWNIAPGHPIARGVGDRIDLPQHEMYGEPHDIPEPDQVVFLSWFAGGNVFRSGCTFTRGLGRIFYFSPGHETYPIYHRPDILKVLSNAAAWAGEFSAGERDRTGGEPRRWAQASHNEKEPLQSLA